MFWETIGCFYVLERAHAIIVKKIAQSLYTLREADQAPERNLCQRWEEDVFRGANVRSAVSSGSGAWVSSCGMKKAIFIIFMIINNMFFSQVKRDIRDAAIPISV